MKNRYVSNRVHNLFAVIGGTIIGINAAFLLLLSTGLPDDAGRVLQRVARVKKGQKS